VWGKEEVDERGRQKESCGQDDGAVGEEGHGEEEGDDKEDPFDEELEGFERREARADAGVECDGRLAEIFR
jgi:hypothetical protein